MCGECIPWLDRYGTAVQSLQPGIFGYCSYLIEKDRKYVCDVLCNGLARLEYRGYDSAGAYFRPLLGSPLPSHESLS